MLARPPRARACAAHRPHAPAGRCAAQRCRIPQPCRRGRGPGRLLRQAGRHPRLVGGGPARTRRGRRPGARQLAGIAADAGFADQAHFTREFRGLTGVTPADWLRAAPIQRNHVRVGWCAFRSLLHSGGELTWTAGRRERREWDTEIGAREHFQVADDEHLFGSFIGVFTQPGPVQAWLAERVSQIEVFHLPSCGGPKLKCAAG